MAVARYLLDTSAVVRAHQRAVGTRLTPLFRRGEVATCGILELEALRSARNAHEAAAMTAEHAGLTRVAIEQPDFDRSADVMVRLARTGHHRGVAIPDLVVAAVAEREGLTVLHYDADFDLIARVTGQTTEWVVPRGTVP